MTHISAGRKDLTNSYNDDQIIVSDASDEMVRYVVRADPNDVNGRSQWVWLRFPSGDLALAVFPQGDTYWEVSDEAPPAEGQVSALHTQDIYLRIPVHPRDPTWTRQELQDNIANYLHTLLYEEFDKRNDDDPYWLGHAITLWASLEDLLSDIKNDTLGVSP